MLDNAFTCSNGHNFRANAKIRTRCPECGVMTRRDFKAVSDGKPPEAKVEAKVEAKSEETKTEPIKTVVKPVLLKQGRPRLMPAKPVVKAKSKSNLIPITRGKVAGGLVKSSRVKVRGTMPRVSARPIKTAPARTVKEHGSPRSSRPYWHDVVDKYGI